MIIENQEGSQNPTNNISQASLWGGAFLRAAGIALMTFPIFLAIVAPSASLVSRTSTRLGITFGVSGGIPVLIFLITLIPWKRGLEAKAREERAWLGFKSKIKSKKLVQLLEDYKSSEHLNHIKEKLARKLASTLRTYYGVDRRMDSRMLASLAQIDVNKDKKIKARGLSVKITKGLLDKILLKDHQPLVEIKRRAANKITKKFHFRGDGRVSMQVLRAALLIEKNKLFSKFEGRTVQEFCKKNIQILNKSDVVALAERYNQEQRA